MVKSPKKAWATCIGCKETYDIFLTPEGDCRWLVVDYGLHIGCCSGCGDSLTAFRENYRLSGNARTYKQGDRDGIDSGRDSST